MRDRLVTRRVTTCTMTDPALGRQREDLRSEACLLDGIWTCIGPHAKYRYVIDDPVAHHMRVSGWLDEGVVMCGPSGYGVSGEVCTERSVKNESPVQSGFLLRIHDCMRFRFRAEYFALSDHPARSSRPKPTNSRCTALADWRVRLLGFCASHSKWKQLDHRSSSRPAYTCEHWHVRGIL